MSTDPDDALAAALSAHVEDARAVFDEARHAHVEQISKAQAELAATLEGHHKRIDAQLADLAAERDAVVAAMAREGVETRTSRTRRRRSNWRADCPIGT